MPVSVIVAATALWVIVGFNIVAVVGSLVMKDIQPVPLIGMVVGLLVLWGFFKRDRLAWQWGRLASLVGLLFFAIVLPFALMALEEDALLGIVTAVFVGVGVVLRPALFISLSRRSAREHFRLFCPECGGRGKAADFWYNRARCVSCGHVW